MKKIYTLLGTAAILGLSYTYLLDDQKLIVKDNLDTSLANKIEKKKSKKKGRLFPGGLSASNTSKERLLKEKEYKQKFSNPITGELGINMRKRELDFAKQMPQSNLAIDFQHRGPYNVGGRTRGFAVDIENENILIAGGVSGGIWKSIDGGSSWQKKTTNNHIGSVTCLVQDKRPGKTNTWYYGTGEGLGNSASATSALYLGNGVYKSTDNGETWTSLVNTAPSSTIGFSSIWQIMYNIVVDNSVSNLDILYAATYDGIFRSEDGGDNWSQVLGAGGGSAYTTNVMVTPNGTTYAFLDADEGTAQKGLNISHDHGLTWENITPDNFAGDFGRTVFDYNPTNENEIYVFSNTPNFGKHTNTFFDGEDWNSLWKYTYDDSDTSSVQGEWIDLSDNLPDTGTSFATLYTQGGYDMAVKVHPTNPNVVYIGGTNIYRSTDGFTSNSNTEFLGGYDYLSVDTNWDITANHHPDQHLIYFPDNNSDVMYSINDGGIFKTNDPMANNSNWISLNNGYYTTQLYAVSVNQADPTNTIIAGFQDNGNFVTKSSNPTSSWVLPYNGDGSFSYVTENEENYYLSIQRGRVGKFSLDAVGNRTGFRRIDPAGLDREGVSFIHPFAVDPNDENFMFYPVLDTLYRQSNLSNIAENGSLEPLNTGWDFIADGLELSGSNKISAVHVTSSNPEHTVYLGTTRRNIYKIENATSSSPIVTTLGYKTAEGVKSYSFGYTSCITTNPDNGNEIISVNTNYETRSLAHSSDGGLTWSDISGNLEENPDGTGDGPSTRWASILPLNNGEKIYFVGTSVGLFATHTLDTLNTHWTHISPDLIGNVVIEQVITRKSDGLVLVATHGNGIYSNNITQISDILDVEEQVVSESIIELLQNPIQNELLFSSQLSEEMDLNIIDISTGKTVFTNREMVQMGQNSLPINIGKGTYIAIFNSSKGSFRKKLSVL